VTTPALRDEVLVSGPPPGWYPDPAGAPATLREWSGTAWTNRTRPAPDRSRPPRVSGPPSDSVTVEAQSGGAATEQHLPTPGGRLRAGHRGRARGTNAIIAVLILMFTVSGGYEVVTGDTSTNNNAARFAQPAAAAADVGGGQGTAATIAGATVSAPPVPAGPCAQARNAGYFINALSSAHLPVRRGGATPQPTGASSAPKDANAACSTTSFVDGRATGSNQLTVYPNATAAAAGAAVHPGAFTVGAITLQLVPALSSRRSEYQSILTHAVG